MRVAALFVEDHAYLNHGFNLINLGGKYIYETNKNHGNIDVSRQLNPQFIPGFFSVSDSTVSIENVSAIVGQNGVGKSTILDIIRRNFVDNKHALPMVKCAVLVEDDDKLLIYSNEYDNFYFDGLKVPFSGLGTLQTIYYSPHLDFRFNPNFDEVDYFDISLDKYIELDLVDIDSMDKNEHGVSFPVKQELLFKNSVRQILFMNSDLVVKDQRFKDVFDFPTHGNAVLFLRGLIKDNNPKNVPYSIRSPLELLDKKVEDELNSYVDIRKFDKKKNLTNDSEVQAYLLKRNLIRHLVSLIFRHMDRSNDYLSSVEFDNELFEQALSNSAYEAFLKLLEATKIPTPNGFVPPFDTFSIKALFDKIYTVADNTNEKDKIKQNELVCSPADAIDILLLHKNVIYDISNYYNKQLNDDSKNLRDLNFLVPDFIYYSPSEKKLSSGENALLNLFSKLYSFLDIKLNINDNPKPEIENFILLFDEADLGFHPVWKKKFVKAIVNTIPYFFEKYPQNPNVQIIFTTHDPLTLSDLPSSNVVCLSIRNKKIEVLEPLKDLKTFGANITDLLANSFFVADGLVGDFAKDKIQDTVHWLKSDSFTNTDKYRRIIELVDEPIVKRKLAEMFDRKMNTDLEINIIDRQISDLQKLKSKLQNDKNPDK